MKIKYIIHLIIAVLLLAFLGYCYYLEWSGITEIFNRAVKAEWLYTSGGNAAKGWAAFKGFLAIIFEYPWVFLRSDIFGYGVTCGSEMLAAYIILLVFAFYMAVSSGVMGVKWKTEDDYDHGVVKTTIDHDKFERGEEYIKTEVTTPKDFADKHNFWVNLIIILILFVLFVVFAPISLLFCIVISLIKAIVTPIKKSSKQSKH